jgi:hypothetical protein
MQIENYTQNGYCVVPQLISQGEAIQLNNEIVKYCKKQKNINKLFYYPERLLRFFDPRFYKNNSLNIEHIKLSLKLIAITNNSNMKNLKKKLKIKKITGIDSYLTEISTKDITKWHCDQSFGGATDPGLYFNDNREQISTNNVNKFFHHITDVNSGNGAFAYLPRSHVIGVSIRKIINAGILKYQPFMDLTDAYTIIDKNYKIFINGNFLLEEEIDFFLINAKKALNKSYDFSIPIKAGGMVVFNDLGFHQGTAPTKSERLVVRYWY